MVSDSVNQPQLSLASRCHCHAHRDKVRIFVNVSGTSGAASAVKVNKFVNVIPSSFAGSCVDTLAYALGENLCECAIGSGGCSKVAPLPARFADCTRIGEFFCEPESLFFQQMMCIAAKGESKCEGN